MSTDLSSAFDTVDHSLLFRKFKHYGIEGDELDLLKSYFSDRTQYVEIETKRSKVINSPPCSVIQGSKLSGILYTLYTNEIPLVHTLLNNKKVMKELTNEDPINTKEVQHETINYVDDSNSSITFNNPDEANTYLLKYFKLLEAFYNASK